MPSIALNCPVETSQRAGWPAFLLRPLLQGGDVGIVQGVLGQIEIAEQPDQEAKTRRDSACRSPPRSDAARRCRRRERFADSSTWTILANGCYRGERPQRRGASRSAESSGPWRGRIQRPGPWARRWSPAPPAGDVHSGDVSDGRLERRLIRLRRAGKADLAYELEWKRRGFRHPWRVDRS